MKNKIYLCICIKVNTRIIRCLDLFYLQELFIFWKIKKKWIPKYTYNGIYYSKCEMWCVKWYFIYVCDTNNIKIFKLLISNFVKIANFVGAKLQ